MSSPPVVPQDQALASRATVLFREERNTIAGQTSHLFGWLLGVQWLVVILLSLVIAPYSWAGEKQSIHPHVLLAVVVGGLLVTYPVWLAFQFPTWQVTRHVVAIAQMGIGSILIHVTGGRIETHFHIFGSLAFLSFYRDWRPLMSATVVVAADHIVRGWLWPMSVYGVSSGAEWRWVEHATWVVFEDAFLLVAIRHSVGEMRASAARQAKLERTNEVIERTVETRTAELRASEERFRAFVDQAADGVFVSDLEGRFLDVNQRACDSLGYSREELLNLSIPDIDVDFTPDAVATIATATQGNKLPTFYGRCVRKDGTMFPVEVRPKLLEMGGRRLVLSLVRDITERKQAEEQIRASEEHYRLLFDANPHPMWVLCPDTKRFLAVNDAATLHYGFRRERFLSMTAMDLNPPYEVGTEPVDTTPIPGRAGQVHNHQRAIGDVRQMELAAHPIEFDGKAALLVLAIDVTDRRVMEEQLKQAQKLESIGQLAAGIAHEINTPIQYIGDNTRFLADAFSDLSSVLAAYRSAGADQVLLQAAESQANQTDLDYLLRETPKALEQTSDGVQQVARIVKAMKEFSHPGSTEKSLVDLNKALETVITVARNEWKYIAEVRTDFDPHLPAIRALPGELNQVFLNLLVNAAHALKSVGEEEGRKRVIAISTSKSGNMVEVRVTDTGCGIPDRIRGRIFDPFFTTKPVGQGTGQGLSIAHSVVVKKHNGALTFDSEVGKGTTFIVRLPVDGTSLTHTERILHASTIRQHIMASPEVA